MTGDDTRAVEVDCTFAENGRVRVRRLRFDGVWLPVEQGRQGEDENGRFVLVMLPGEPVRLLRLERDTLRWVLIALPGDDRHDVV